MVDLNGKTIVVTGASGGIGREVAILSSQLGAKLVLIARSEANLQESLARMRGSGHRHITFDLTRLNQYEQLFAAIREEAGPIDGLVHSAGTNRIVPLRNISRQDIDNVMVLNYYSFLLLAKHAAKKQCFSEQGGAIIGISSIASGLAKKGYSLYSASKAALNASIKCLAQEYGNRALRFNAVSPGFIKTALSDANSRFYTLEAKDEMVTEYALGAGRPADIAATVAFLLSDSARWITGTVVTVDGGYCGSRSSG